MKGATALLCSAARLPQNRCGAGGLNLRLARKLADEQLAALVSAYFAMGGVNLAPSVLTKETLLAAREHPERYSESGGAHRGLFRALSPLAGTNADRNPQPDGVCTMNGYVSNIQRFSTQDGPGLRTTVFLEGCPASLPLVP